MQSELRMLGTITYQEFQQLYSAKAIDHDWGFAYGGGVIGGDYVISRWTGDTIETRDPHLRRGGVLGPTPHARIMISSYVETDGSFVEWMMRVGPSGENASTRLDLDALVRPLTSTPYDAISFSCLDQVSHEFYLATVTVQGPAYGQYQQADGPFRFQYDMASGNVTHLPSTQFALGDNNVVGAWLGDPYQRASLGTGLVDGWSNIGAQVVNLRTGAQCPTAPPPGYNPIVQSFGWFTREVAWANENVYLYDYAGNLLRHYQAPAQGPLFGGDVSDYGDIWMYPVGDKPGYLDPDLHSVTWYIVWDDVGDQTLYPFNFTNAEAYVVGTGDTIIAPTNFNYYRSNPVRIQGIGGDFADLAFVVENYDRSIGQNTWSLWVPGQPSLDLDSLRTRFYQF